MIRQITLSVAVMVRYDDVINTMCVRVWECVVDEAMCWWIGLHGHLASACWVNDSETGSDVFVRAVAVPSTGIWWCRPNDWSVGPHSIPFRPSVCWAVHPIYSISRQVTRAARPVSLDGIPRRQRQAHRPTIDCPYADVSKDRTRSLGLPQRRPAGPRSA